MTKQTTSGAGSATLNSDEAFGQIFAGAALGAIWSVIAGFIILLLDGVWRTMAIAAFFAVVIAAIIMMARAGGLGRYALGLGICVLLATGVIALLVYFD